MSAPVKPDAVDEPPATEAVLVSEIIPATRERIFAAWMNSDQHSAFTGDQAVIDPIVGGLHSSFDGYASGTTMSLEPFRRIVQTWRSTDFPKTSPDSLLEITLEETVGGTLVTLLHSEIPTGQSDRCREAWLTLYLEPLKRYFTGRVSNGVHAADKKALAAPRKRASAQRSKAPRAIAASKATPPRRKAVSRAKAARPTAGGKTRPVARAAGANKARKKTVAKAAGKPTAKAAAKRPPAARKRKPATRRSQTAKTGAKRSPTTRTVRGTKLTRAGKTKRKPRR